MAINNEDLVFAKEDTNTKDNLKLDDFWNVLIVDDDVFVHKVTEIALLDFEFEGKRIKFYHAYSGKEACDFLLLNDNIELIFLDVVMESDNAGLLVVDYIRKELKNIQTQIILRTGHPGDLNIKNIMINYEINDLKLKTGFTAQDMFITTVAAIRTYKILKRAFMNLKNN